MNDRTTRLAVSLIAFQLLVVACTHDRVPGQAAGCQLSEVPNSSAEKAVPSSVAELGDGVLVVGTAYTGSKAGALAGEGRAGVWTPDAIRAYTGLLEIDDVAASGGAAWAVGTIGTRAPAIARWDGHAWSAAKVRDPGPGEDGLSAVVTLSSASAWAVGRHQVDLGFDTLIERWDGRSWKPVPSPNQGTTSSALRDVAAIDAADVWAVGWLVQEGHYRTLSLHWDGTRWNVIPMPAAGGDDAVLSAVLARSTDDVWAAGWTTRGEVVRPLVERWNGHLWSVIPTPSELGDASFSAIAATKTGIVLVGRQLDGSQIHPLAELQAQGVWTNVPVQIPDDSAWFNGVAVDANSAIWAVGNRAPDNGVTSSLLVTGCSV